MRQLHLSPPCKDGEKMAVSSTPDSPTVENWCPAGISNYAVIKVGHYMCCHMHLVSWLNWTETINYVGDICTTLNSNYKDTKYWEVVFSNKIGGDPKTGAASAGLTLTFSLMHCAAN